MTDKTRDTFGAHVKRLREARGLTQEELSTRSGLAADTIRRLEHQEFSPSLRTLRKVCAGLDMTVSTLFLGYEMPESTPELDRLLDLTRGLDEAEQRVIISVVEKIVDYLNERAKAR